MKTFYYPPSIITLNGNTRPQLIGCLTLLSLFVNHLSTRFGSADYCVITNFTVNVTYDSKILVKC
jgi:hypothetical protein